MLERRGVLTVDASVLTLERDRWPLAGVFRLNAAVCESVLVRRCEGATEARAHAMSFGTQVGLGHVPVHAKFEGHKVKLKAV